MCVREGFIEVVDWWKEVELVELFWKLHKVDKGECWIICTTMNINKHPQI
jgi:hypothetical protein